MAGLRQSKRWCVRLGLDYALAFAFIRRTHFILLPVRSRSGSCPKSRYRQKFEVNESLCHHLLTWVHFVTSTAMFPIEKSLRAHISLAERPESSALALSGNCFFSATSAIKNSTADTFTCPRRFTRTRSARRKQNAKIRIAIGQVGSRPNGGPGTLPSQPTRADHQASCQARGYRGEIGAGESAGPTTYSRHSSPIRRELCPASQSADLPSHERFSAASGWAYIEMCEARRLTRRPLASCSIPRSERRNFLLYREAEPSTLP